MKKMKAAIYTRYGPPEVAHVAEVPMPSPTEKEILIKVYSSTVNRTDAGFRSAEYVVSRFWSGLFRPKLKILGSEFSGIVEEVGAQVTNFKKGDRVFGFNDQTFGGHGEYLTLPAHAAVATLHPDWSFDDAAPMTEGAHYALVNIRAAKVKEGQHVLVYGATGAIGSAAVQLLKHFGAKVTAVCHSKYVDMVKSLGADVVVDYTTQDYTQSSERYDFIFDAVGKTSFFACRKVLAPKGIYISTEPGKNGINIALALLTPWLGGKRLLFPLPSISQQDVLFLKKLREKGIFKPVLDRYYPMDQIVAAFRYVGSGQKIGNVVLKIVP